MSWDDGFLRERGRPARTKPGTALAISPTWINRERRHGSGSAWPMGLLPTGGCLQLHCKAARPKEQSAAPRSRVKGTVCGRDARAPG